MVSPYLPGLIAALLALSALRGSAEPAHLVPGGEFEGAVLLLEPLGAEGGAFERLGLLDVAGRGLGQAQEYLAG